MRFFFDLNKEPTRLLDYAGEKFPHPDLAIRHAKSVADHMSRHMSGWLGWIVEVRDAAGGKLVAVPVELTDNKCRGVHVTFDRDGVTTPVPPLADGGGGAGS